MKYRVLHADPGWQFTDSLPGPGRGASKHYRCEQVEQICNRGLPNPDQVDENAWLFLWRVAAMQEEALRVARAWGFGAPLSEIVWVKTVSADYRDALRRAAAARKDGVLGAISLFEEARRLRIGMGRSVRNCHEVCLIFKRGRPARLNADVPSVVFAPRSEHSEKPEEVAQAIERLSEGPYLELFARRHREGWTCLGDQLDGG